MCEKFVQAFLPVSKFVPDLFVTNKMLEKLDNAVTSNDYILLVHVDSNSITFLSNDIAFNTIDFNNINFDDNNFDKDDPETTIHVRHCLV